MKTAKELIDYINSDRSKDWTDYNETDWREGLEVFTEFKITAEFPKENLFEITNTETGKIHYVRGGL